MGLIHQGLTSLNGIDYFPEVFLNSKYKFNMKKEQEAEQVVNDEMLMNAFDTGRPLSAILGGEGTYTHLNRVHPANEVNPQPLSNELIQQL